MDKPLHPLEVDVTLSDGRVVRVNGKLAVDWRSPEKRAAIIEYVEQELDRATV